MEWATLYADNKPFLTLRPPSDIPKQTNCPNCCAPINGKRCEYCGTWFVEPEEIEKENWLHYELGSQIGNLQNQISQARIELAASMQTTAILSSMDARNIAIQPLSSNCVIWSNNPKTDPVSLDYDKVTSLQNSLGPSFMQIDIPTEEEEVSKENWFQKFIHKIIGG